MKSVYVQSVNYGRLQACVVIIGQGGRGKGGVARGAWQGAMARGAWQGGRGKGGVARVRPLASLHQWCQTRSARSFRRGKLFGLARGVKWLLNFSA